MYFKISLRIADTLPNKKFWERTPANKRKGTTIPITFTSTIIKAVHAIIMIGADAKNVDIWKNTYTVFISTENIVISFPMDAYFKLLCESLSTFWYKHEVKILLDIIPHWFTKWRACCKNMLFSK